MPETLRLDKFLWFARFFKTRAQAAAAIEAGEVSLNGQAAVKPAQSVRPGDDLVFPTGKRWRRVEVVALPHRRGPAPEARSTYVESDESPAQD